MPGYNIQNAYPSGNKHPYFIVFIQLIIDISKYILRFFPRLCVVLYQSFCNYHKKGGRHSFSRYIRNDNGQVNLIYHKKVIEIAADFLRRRHACINVKLLVLRICGKNIGEHIGLNLSRHIQLRAAHLLHKGVPPHQTLIVRGRKPQQNLS